MEYQLDNGCLRLLVSSCGAQMQAIEKDGAQYLWDGNEEYWPERAPLLFPFVGRFTEGKYRLDGQEYEMDIHGFARKLPVSGDGADEEKISLELRDSQETFASYPYHFILQVSYTLQKNRSGLSTKYRILQIRRCILESEGIRGSGFRWRMAWILKITIWNSQKNAARSAWGIRRPAF
mgnify:CR=1 FL=1